MSRIVVIGAGVGGLTCAAVLARAGFDVTVLEAHVYPGGCAGTFYHQGYTFDAGATLAAGFYPGGPMDRVAKAAGMDEWGCLQPAEQIMAVHLPYGQSIPIAAGEERWEARRSAFGAHTERFFHWQERTADALWDLALRLPAWPAQDASDAAQLARKGLDWLAAAPGDRLSPSLAADAFRPVAAHLRGAPEALRLFVDAQLLISAQATSRQVNALYGASALDLPRRGVVHLEGGMGSIAKSLVGAVRQHGGRVLFRKEVAKIVLERGQPVAVETTRGERFPADIVICNLPPGNLAALLKGEALPRQLRKHAFRPRDGWGAFVVYLGVDGSVVDRQSVLHHQVVVGEPLGEANSVFLSISPEWDSRRAPAGMRAITLSTHTALDAWWRLYENDRDAYNRRKQDYASRMLAAAETAIPGLRQAASLILPGTPVTFQRFTRRYEGWVGGFPQTSLFRFWGPRLGRGLYMVGDSIFPGQSTAAVALGGLRVAGQILNGQNLQPSS